MSARMKAPRRLADALRIIKEKAAGAINVKLMKTGLVHALEISRLAHAAGVKLMIGGMMESNLAMTASAHLAAGLGYFDFIDLDTPFFIKGEAARNPYLSSQGIYDLSKVKAWYWDSMTRPAFLESNSVSSQILA